MEPNHPGLNIVGKKNNGTTTNEASNKKNDKGCKC